MSGNETETQAIFLELRRTLDEAKTRSKNHNISVNLALLAMLLESENERERTHGFVGKIQCLERQLQRVRLERDTFSDEVDHLKRQIDACHAKIDELKNDADKSTTQKRELSEFLKNAMDENRALKAVRIVSIERGGGVIRKIGSTGPSAYTMQIEFSKVRFPVDG